MQAEKINAQTVMLHLPKNVDADHAESLKHLLQSYVEEGVQYIHIDLSLTELIHKTCLMPMIICHQKLIKSGGEVRLINVKGDYVKHLFEMLTLHKVINIEGYH